MNKINLKINPAVDDNELTKQQYLILKAELSRLEKYIQHDLNDTYRNGNAKSEIFARFCG